MHTELKYQDNGEDTYNMMQDMRFPQQWTWVGTWCSDVV